MGRPACARLAFLTLRAAHSADGPAEWDSGDGLQFKGFVVEGFFEDLWAAGVAAFGLLETDHSESATEALTSATAHTVKQAETETEDMEKLPGSGGMGISASMVLYRFAQVMSTVSAAVAMQRHIFVTILHTNART